MQNKQRCQFLGSGIPLKDIQNVVIISILHFPLPGMLVVISPVKVEEVSQKLQFTVKHIPVDEPFQKIGIDKRNCDPQNEIHCHAPNDFLNTSEETRSSIGR